MTESKQLDHLSLHRSWKQKNQLELYSHASASKDYASSDLNREEKVRASDFFFLNCHFICCVVCYISVSLYPIAISNSIPWIGIANLYTSTNAFRWCGASCRSSFAIDWRDWWFSCKKKMALLLSWNQRKFIFSWSHFSNYLLLLYKPVLSSMYILKLSVLRGKSLDYIYTMSQI